MLEQYAYLIVVALHCITQLVVFKYGMVDTGVTYVIGMQTLDLKKRMWYVINLVGVVLQLTVLDSMIG